MRLGLFMMPVHLRRRTYTEVLRDDVDIVVQADRFGFDEAWIGEHFTATAEPIVSPLIFLASLIARTSRIKLATGVLNLPQRHPAVIAAEAAMFDHLSEGRLIMGIGPGGLPSDFELFKTTDPTERMPMMLESIDMILKIWSQDPPYRMSGKYWDISLKDFVFPDIGVGGMAKPYQKPHPPIVLSAMSPSSSSVRTAALRGFGAVSANFIPACHVRSHWDVFVESCKKIGRIPRPDDWRVARTVFVADRDAEARAYVRNRRSSVYAYYDYFVKLTARSNVLSLLKADPSMPDSSITADHLVESLVIAGDPDSVAEQLANFREEVGPFGTVLVSTHDYDKRERWLRSMELMATEVMPRLRKAVGMSYAAD